MVSDPMSFNNCNFCLSSPLKKGKKVEDEKVQEEKNHAREKKEKKKKKTKKIKGANEKKIKKND